MMARLLSVNVGLPRDITWQGRTVHTAIWKAPVEGPRMVRGLNIDGDGQGDLAGHGGEHRAVFVYQIDSYRYNKLGRDDFRVPTIWLANHGVAETEKDMRALLLGAPGITKQPISCLMPARRGALFRWCLTEGYRATKPMTLMTIGEYREPQGSYFPSVLY
jgi:hypothetical protein